MRILGIETSTAVCSVGLFRDGEPGIEQSVRESHIHSEKLLTLVQDVMRSGGIGLEHLDAIAISIGPGSFTGLRIGLSTAKGLSFALDKPLVAVSSFEAIAEAARRKYQASGSVAVLIDAKKEEWYMGRFLVAGSNVLASAPVAVKSLGEAVAVLKGEKSTLILTDKVDEMRRALDIGATIEDVHACCRGDVVASVGYTRVLNKEFSDAALLEPMYLKDFVVRAAVSITK
jgi:tRNA threonylcarbamoyladenosine biosynthesis protein TsaB